MRLKNFFLFILLLCMAATLSSCSKAYEGLEDEQSYCDSSSDYYAAYSDSTANWRPAGSSSEPYIICTAADLEQLSSDVAGGQSFSGYYFEQYADIDLSGSTSFTPIGSSSASYFSGNYDGNGYAIENLALNLVGVSYVGLFGYAVDSEITNVNLTNFDIQADSHVAGLVGFLEFSSASTGNIDSNTIEGSITCTSSRCGGLLGGLDNYRESDLFISNNSVDLQIPAGGGKVGGLIGYLQHLASSGEIKITENIIAGDFIVQGRTGGLIGDILTTAANVYIDLNASSVNIDIESGLTWTVQGVGGLIGYLYGSGSAEVVRCYASGKINESDYKLANAGGLIGWIHNLPTSIAATYANTTIKSPDLTALLGSATPNRIGGLIGKVAMGAAITNQVDISSSLAAGSVTAYDELGGLVGILEAGSGTINIQSSYATATLTVLTDALGLVSTNYGFIGSLSTAGISVNSDSYFSGSTANNGLGTTEVNLESCLKEATSTNFSTSTKCSTITLFPSGISLSRFSDLWGEFTYDGSDYPTLDF